MAFDPSTARAEDSGGFDPATARPLPPPGSIYERTAKSDSGLTNFNAAIGGALSGIPLGLKAITGNASPDDVQQWKDSMAGLWSTPMGKAGTIAGGAAALAPATMLTGASVPGAAAVGAGYGLIQPETDWLSRAKNALLSALGSAGGQAIGNALASAATKYALPPSSFAPKQQLAQQAQDAGLKVAPNEAGQQSLLQWIGGQKTQQTMASKNVPRITELAAQEVGLPAGPITRDALAGIRQQAGSAYDAVAQAGTIPADKPFQAVAQNISSAYQQLTQSFKSLRSQEIETLISDLHSPAFDAGGLVEAVKRFRADGFENLGKGPAEKALGRVQLQAQEALDGLADRFLKQAGQPDAVANLQSARQLIAKTYSVQNALDANGNVIASKLVAQANRGKPLSGNLQTIAEMGAAFPKSMQNLQATPPAFSPLDMATALLAHSVKGALSLGASPLARAVMASAPYQKSFIAPGPMPGAGLLAGAANNPYLRLLETTSLPAGLLGANQ